MEYQKMKTKDEAIANPNLYDNNRFLSEKAKNDYKSCCEKYIFPDWFYDYPSEEELQIWATQYNMSINDFKVYMKYFNFCDKLFRKKGSIK